ncbi:MAG: FAD-binding oxidoreductase, partial [Candidatus Paceibacterota bacterium]
MKEEIQKFFKGDIDDTEETLVKYSHDASVFEIKPALVLFPKDGPDVENLVAWASANKAKYPHLAITARCAGTCMSGGAIGESIILDFTRYMNNLIDFTDKGKITVEPGMFYRDFEKITLEKGMILPCYTASKNLNAVGGMFGNNSAGERTLRFGKTEDYVIESEVVFQDGKTYKVKPLSKIELETKIAQGDFEGNLYKKIYELALHNDAALQKAKPKVSKNSAGYTLWNVLDTLGVRGASNYFDLNKILVGSQGTLGIATQITFRLIEEAKYR